MGSNAIADALLAALVLGSYLGLARTAGIEPDTDAIFAGAGATLAFEYAASRHQETVRRLWKRRGVRATSVAAAALYGAATLRAGSGRLLGGGLGALVAYLALLGGVEADVVPHPTEW